MASVFGEESRRLKRREAKRLDIVIDGRPLRVWWRQWEQPGWDFDVPVAALVTRLSRSSKPEALTQLSQLRGPTAGQTPTTAELLYCAACFDISDGILGVQISRSPGTVTWVRLGWIENHDGITDDALIPNAPDLTFATDAYDQALNDAHSMLTNTFHRR